MTQLQNIVMSALLLSGMLTGALLWSGDLFNQFGTGVQNSDEFSSLETVRDNTSTQTNQYITEAEGQTQGIPQDIEQEFTFLSSVGNALTNIYTSVGALTSGIGELASGTKRIPTWFSLMLGSMLIAAAVFGLTRRF